MCLKLTPGFLMLEVEDPVHCFDCANLLLPGLEVNAAKPLDRKLSTDLAVPISMHNCHVISGFYIRRILFRHHDWQVGNRFNPGFIKVSSSKYISFIIILFKLHHHII